MVESEAEGMKKYNLVEKSKYLFIYENTNERFKFTQVIEIGAKNTLSGYKGIQVMSYQKGCNTDGFNNAVGLRRSELLILPFMILHFKLYRLFHRK